MSRIKFGGGCYAHLLFGLLASIVSISAQATSSPTLEAARARGSFSCGVVVEQEDFTKTDTHGDLSTFSGQICRAVAAAVLGQPGRATLVGFPDDAHGIAGLEQGKVALLVGTTPGATQAMLHHLVFSPALFMDGQGFLARGSLHAKALADLHDQGICFLSETPAQPGLLEWQSRAHVAIRSDPYEEAGEMEAALATGHCDVITAAVSTLANMRSGFHGHRADFDILPQTITIEPFAAATRDRDPVWSTIVSDVVTVLIEAEQDGIDRANLVSMQSGTDPSAQRLLGPTPGLESLLGLKDGWAARSIAVSGNYGELLAATTGPGTRLNLPRGVNALWNAGGLIHATAIP